MNKPLVINKVAEQMGVTSRTLRHWESEKLFNSTRDADSGWRIYDESAILCIRITSLLRKIDIPIKDIKSVLSCMNISKLNEVISNKILVIDNECAEIIFRRKQLEQLISFLSERSNLPINDESLYQIQEVIRNFENINIKKEDLPMINLGTAEHVKFITLPSMRMVYHIAISATPEDEAMEPVLTWIKSANLMGTARLFGGNMKPMPSGEGKPYGYGFCATIPESVTIPEYLKEMTLPGGLYAVVESTEDIEVSWKTLMKHLSSHDKYKSDCSRLCLEEHIRNDNPEGFGNEYSLRLMEPVKVK
ncbi:MAG TPA: MerR family transcriptional regulator [Clostridiales bacterium]|nr:MerR family transcriptional regulator [Clostridiales bacterium]